MQMRTCGKNRGFLHQRLVLALASRHEMPGWWATFTDGTMTSTVLSSIGMVTSGILSRTRTQGRLVGSSTLPTHDHPALMEGHAQELFHRCGVRSARNEA